MANPWLSCPGSHGNLLWLGLCGLEHYLGPGKVILEGVSCSGIGLLQHTSLHLLVSWCRAAQPAHFCHHSEIQSIRWQKDRHYHLFPTQTSMCLSPCCLRTWARPSVWCNLNLDWSVKIQCHQWRMSQTCWRIAPDSGADDALNWSRTSCRPVKMTSERKKTPGARWQATFSATN